MSLRSLVALPFALSLLGMCATGATAADLSGIVSDDFNDPVLNAGVWTFSDPKGDATLTMTGTAANIAVPAGISHDLWTGTNTAPRLMQVCNDADFEVEAKFESALADGNEMQGILVEADSQNYIRFDFISDGTNTRIFAASFLAGSPTVRKNAVIGGVPSSTALYLRVKRTGSQWSQSYSLDGSNWVAAADFSHTMTVGKVGVFAGNAVGNPAFAGVVDHFLNRSESSAALLSDSPNVVVNPGFENGTSPWAFYSNGTASFATDAAGPDSAKAGRVAISQPGTNVQLYQAGLTLEANAQYTLTFKAKSSSGHDMAMNLLKHVSPYTNYGVSNRAFNLTSAWQSFTTQFTTSGFVGVISDARLSLAMHAYDAAGDQYYFDDVTLTKGSSSTPTAPTITTQPASRTVTAGQTASFSVSATGTAPLSYQWQKNGTSIIGATGSLYTTPATTLSDSGATFRVIVTNSVGSITSGSATLTVNQYTQPTGQLLLLDRRFVHSRSYTAADVGEVPSSTNVNCIYVASMTPPRNVCNHEAFKFFQMPANNPTNWTSPVDYSKGTLHQRVQIITKPSLLFNGSPITVMYAICMFQDIIDPARHACGDKKKILFTSTGTYYSSQAMNALYQYGTAVDWNRRPHVLMLHMMDKSGHQPDSYPDFMNLWYGTPNWDLYYPMELRYTAIIVPPGGSAPVWP